jgi:hypothetical protein
MMIFAIGVEHAFNLAVQRPHDADARHHRRAVLLGDQDQTFHCCLPFRHLVFGLWKLSDVVASVLQRDEAAPAGQRDWNFERPLPAGHFLLAFRPLILSPNLAARLRTYACERCN